MAQAGRFEGGARGRQGAGLASGRVLGWAAAIVGIAAAALVLLSAPRFRTDSGAPRGDSAGAMQVVVSVAPLVWPIKALAPDISVTLLAPAGAGCEGVDLTPSHFLALEKADLVLLTGLGLEPNVEQMLRRGGPSRRSVVRMADVLTEAEREAAEHAHHHDDEAHPHHHMPDQHVWLDPALMERLIDRLADVLNDRLGDAPEKKEALEARRLEAIEKVRAVDADYRRGLAPLAGRGFVSQHAAFHRLADRYGLVVTAVIQSEHGAEPTPGDIAAAAEAVRSSGVRVVFLEPQLPSAAARRIAEVTGARLQTLDPLGDGDWPALMRKNLTALIAGLSDGPASSGRPTPE